MKQLPHLTICLSLFIALFSSAYASDLETEKLLKDIFNTQKNNTKLSNKQVQQVKKGLNTIFDNQVKLISAGESYLPSALKSNYIFIARDLYLAGFAKGEFFEAFKNEYKILEKFEENEISNFAKLKKLKVSDVLSRKNIRLEFLKNENRIKKMKQKYSVILSKYISQIQRSPKKCMTSSGVDATANQCCAGFVRVQSVKQELKSKKCQNDKACKSLVCEIGEGEKIGTCAKSFICAKAVVEGQSCLEKTDLCVGSRCVKMDKVDLLVATCIASNSVRSCKRNSECCSNICNGGKCSPKMQCSNCVKSGISVTRRQKCCPGFTLNAKKNRCIKIRPHFIPSTTMRRKNIIRSIFDILISSASASTAAANDDGKLSPAQMEFIQEKTKECSTVYIKGPARDDCHRRVDELSKSYTDDNVTILLPMQEAELDLERNKCASLSVKDGEICMAKVDKLENSMRSENKKNGVSGDPLTSGNLINTAEIPMPVGKTYSDVKSCKFNTSNDNWRDASLSERRAEVFLRAFEYTFSNDGTQDYWEDGAEGNIFTRAKRVAVQFRKNRNDLTDAIDIIDIEMSCKCMTILGPEKFTADRQTFFATSCAEYKKEVQVALGSSTDGKQENSKIGENEKDIESKMAEVDLGATGIAHERLLLEWLSLRREAQMKRFLANENLEKDLTAISKFITKTSDDGGFETVFFNKLSNRGKPSGASPRGDTGWPLSGFGGVGPVKEYYKWGFKYPAGIMRLFKSVTSPVGATTIALGAHVVQYVSKGRPRATFGGNSVSVKDGLDAAWGDKFHPRLSDEKTRGGATFRKILGVTIEKYDGFHRWFSGPRFDNEATNSQNRCQVYGRSAACFRVAYATDFLTGGAYIVDPTRPMFVSKNDLNTEVMPNQTKNWVAMINEARNSGVSYIYSKRSTGGLKGGYKNGGTSHGSQNKIPDAIDAGHFIPRGLDGQAYIPVVSNHAAAIKAGALKYARAMSLRAAGGVDSETVGDKVYGFASLYESDTDAENFAKYAYEFHWKYSHISKNSYMGYPLIGMDVYFSAAANNMALLGRIAASRALKYGETYDIYKADLEKRLKDYSALGTAGIGLGSKNITFSDKFYEGFKMLSFDGDSNLGEFGQATKDSLDTSSFTAAELKAYDASKNAAFRLSKQVKSSGVAIADAKIVNNDPSVNNPTVNAFSNSGLSGGVTLRRSGNGIGRKSTDLLASINSNLGKLVDKEEKINSLPNFYSSSTPNIEGGQYLPSASFPSSSPGTDSLPQAQREAISPEVADAIIERLAKNSELNMIIETDTLFQIVTKVYRRNLSRVLVRASDLRAKEGTGLDVVEKKKKTLNQEQKDSLRILLDKTAN